MAFIKFIFKTLSSIGSTVFGGFVFAVLWAWFVSSTFDVIPPITVIEAIGLSLVFAYITHRVTPQDIKDIESNPDFSFMAHVIAWFKPAFFLLFGFIVHLFY
jgi:hypothetical protein